MPKSKQDIESAVAAYYRDKLSQHGASPKGVDWNGEDSQVLRFQRLLDIVPPTDEAPLSINEIGCGYGALVEYLERSGRPFVYTGADIAPEMLDAARRLHGTKPHVRFCSSADELPETDYTVASGIFNVRLDVADEAWRTYICSEIDLMSRKSRKGFAFNLLTRYCDRDRMRDYLYYADPLFFFDHIARLYSRKLSILQDYSLFEFTLLARKQL